MNYDNNNSDEEESAEKRVTDEEGTVDEQIKRRVLKARDRVDEREDDVFVGVPLDPENELSNGEKVEIWGRSVRQYLKTIEPLLRSDEIANARHYYREIEILDESIYPPDGDTRFIPAKRNRGEYIEPFRWSRFYDDTVPRRTLIGEHELFGREFEAPDPKKIELYGLKDVIETEGIEKQWRVVLNPGALPPDQHIAEVFYTTPLTKEVLENAVRRADTFLQQAGIGLEIGHEKTDDPDDDPF